MTATFNLGIEGLETQSLDEVGTNDRGSWLIHGPQGHGKSLLASTIAQCGPTLFVDMPGEKGVRSFKGSPWARNIQVTRPTSVSQLDDLYWKLAGGDHPFKAVIVDSGTSIQKLGMRFVMGYSETVVREIRQGAAPPDQRSWGRTLDIMADFSNFWFDLAKHPRNPMHIVVTCQTKMVDNEDTGARDRVPDVQKGALSAFLANPDYVLYCEAVDNPDAAADENAPRAIHTVRFGAHPGYSTKARLPFHLNGRIPPVLGMPNAETGKITMPNLTNLSRILEIGGVPAPAARKTKPATATEEN